MILGRQSSQLVLVDIQEKLLPAMAEPDRVVACCAKLIAAAARLDVPVTVTEQYPEGIGHTVKPLTEALTEALGNRAKVMRKLEFSALRDKAIANHLGGLKRAGRPQAVIAGIESHVCVLQTALDLQTRGFDSFVVADAVDSRAPKAREIALDRMRASGIMPVTTEMVLFEWLGRAGTDDFRALLPLIKG